MPKATAIDPFGAIARSGPHAPLARRKGAPIGMQAWVRMMRGAAVIAATLHAAPALAAGAQPPEESVSELAQLSIEELSQVQVTSASKRAEPISEAPTAIYVIGNDDILRSSATSLPELLREAPNLEVQRIDAREYAITARGFNGYEAANKLLVRIDGRSIYSTLSSGVFWDLHNPLLEDIDQIEVISGPGGTLYGANAVNGVINVASKDALDTIGGLARVTAGADERTAALRYGVGLGGDAAVRVYGTYFDRESLPAGTFQDYDDGIEGWQAGFRGDLASDRDHLTFQGDIFDNDTRLLPGEGNKGHNLLARWSRALDADSALQLQGYYDWYKRLFSGVRDELETFDVEAQYNRTAGIHEIVAGIGVRTTRDDIVTSTDAAFLDPESSRLWFFNGFVQDEIGLTSTFTLTGGLKLESSTFTGLQLLPNLRLAWQPDGDTLLWAAVSRAVRTPSRVDRELAAPPVLTKSPDFAAEKLVALETGYRGRPTPTTTLSVSLYLNFYDDLRSIELISGGTQVQLRNGIKGRAYGLEAWAAQQIASWWRLTASVNMIGKHFERKPGVVDVADIAAVGRDPNYQLQLRSQMNLTDRLSLDIDLRDVDGLKDPDIPTYAEANARLAYRLSDAVELYVAGSNLLHDRHLESNDADQGQAISRMVYAGTRLRF